MKHKEHKKCDSFDPQIPQFFSGWQVLLVYILYFLGLLWLYPLPADAFMAPLFTVEKAKIGAKLLGARKRFIVRLLMYLVGLMSANSAYLFRHLRARGVVVVLWVLNSEDEFEEAVEMGEIDGVMTDEPTKLRAFVEQQ